MVRASFTYVDDLLHTGVAPFDEPEDSATEKFALPQQARIFYGGQIVNNLGAFVQITYDGNANALA